MIRYMHLLDGKPAVFETDEDGEGYLVYANSMNGRRGAEALVLRLPVTYSQLRRERREHFRTMRRIFKTSGGPGFRIGHARLVL